MQRHDGAFAGAGKEDGPSFVVGNNNNGTASGTPTGSQQPSPTPKKTLVLESGAGSSFSIDGKVWCLSGLVTVGAFLVGKF